MRPPRWWTMSVMWLVHRVDFGSLTPYVMGIALWKWPKRIS